MASTARGEFPLIIEKDAMATAAQLLTPEQFEAQYNCEKPNYEYWYGEAIQKATATNLHGILQFLLMTLLRDAGYLPRSEVRLKLNPSVWPVPDVIASLDPIQPPYPTRPFEVAIEILSPEDPFRRTLKKFRLYREWGIRHVFIVDGEDRVIREVGSHGEIQETDTLPLDQGRSLPTKRIWDELDRYLAGATSASEEN